MNHSNKLSHLRKSVETPQFVAPQAEVRVVSRTPKPATSAQTDQWPMEDCTLSLEFGRLIAAMCFIRVPTERYHTHSFTDYHFLDQRFANYSHGLNLVYGLFLQIKSYWNIAMLIP